METRGLEVRSFRLPGDVMVTGTSHQLLRLLSPEGPGQHLRMILRLESGEKRGVKRGLRGVLAPRASSISDSPMGK